MNHRWQHLILFFFIIFCNVHTGLKIVLNIYYNRIEGNNYKNVKNTYMSHKLHIFIKLCQLYLQ